MERIKIYGSAISGNCLKVKWTADLLGITYDWIETDILKGETRTETFLALSPAGQIPIVVLEDGRVLEQSCAIMLYLAEQSGSNLVPSDPFEKATMISWLFWEQNFHESSIAVRRFRKRFARLSDDDIDPTLLTRGNASLSLMENHLAAQDYFGGTRLGLPDIALVAYTRMAGEGGYALADYPAVQAWIARVEAALGIPSYTEEQA
ncbi:glutathione S-transferase family protein [Parvularcula sp. IMCC14364]|uniref:glutathione S-transferase family protein n=1 Tax=Parvularcula sp. IMCC14364 TaxID=3067902 RepID=UPI00274299A1|nr:glutathione S-transferase family protein [Parvularcula sp. IMCC14364]